MGIQLESTVSSFEKEIQNTLANSSTDIFEQAQKLDQLIIEKYIKNSKISSREQEIYQKYNELIINDMSKIINAESYRIYNSFNIDLYKKGYSPESSSEDMKVAQSAIDGPIKEGVQIGKYIFYRSFLENSSNDPDNVENSLILASQRMSLVAAKCLISKNYEGAAVISASLNYIPNFIEKKQSEKIQSINQILQNIPNSVREIIANDSSENSFFIPVRSSENFLFVKTKEGNQNSTALFEQVNKNYKLKDNEEIKNYFGSSSFSFKEHSDKESATLNPVINQLKAQARQGILSKNTKIMNSLKNVISEKSNDLMLNQIEKKLSVYNENKNKEKNSSIALENLNKLKKRRKILSSKNTNKIIKENLTYLTEINKRMSLENHANCTDIEKRTSNDKIVLMIDQFIQNINNDKTHESHNIQKKNTDKTYENHDIQKMIKIVVDTTRVMRKITREESYTSINLLAFKESIENFNRKNPNANIDISNIKPFLNKIDEKGKETKTPNSESNGQEKIAVAELSSTSNKSVPSLFTNVFQVSENNVTSSESSHSSVKVPPPVPPRSIKGIAQSNDPLNDDAASDTKTNLSNSTDIESFIPPSIVDDESFVPPTIASQSDVQTEISEDDASEVASEVLPGLDDVELPPLPAEASDNANKVAPSVPPRSMQNFAQRDNSVNTDVASDIEMDLPEPTGMELPNLEALASPPATPSQSAYHAINHELIAVAENNDRKYLIDPAYSQKLDKIIVDTKDQNLLTSFTDYKNLFKELDSIGKNASDNFEGTQKKLTQFAQLLNEDNLKKIYKFQADYQNFVENTGNSIILEESSAKLQTISIMGIQLIPKLMIELKDMEKKNITEEQKIDFRKSLETFKNIANKLNTIVDHEIHAAQAPINKIVQNILEIKPVNESFLQGGRFLGKLPDNVKKLITSKKTVSTKSLNKDIEDIIAAIEKFNTIPNQKLQGSEADKKINALIEKLTNKLEDKQQSKLNKTAVNNAKRMKLIVDQLRDFVVYTGKNEAHIEHYSKVFEKFDDQIKLFEQRLSTAISEPTNLKELENGSLESSTPFKESSSKLISPQNHESNFASQLQNIENPELIDTTATTNLIQDNKPLENQNNNQYQTALPILDGLKAVRLFDGNNKNIQQTTALLEAIVKGTSNDIAGAKQGIDTLVEQYNAKRIGKDVTKLSQKEISDINQLIKVVVDMMTVVQSLPQNTDYVPTNFGSPATPNFSKDELQVLSQGQKNISAENLMANYQKMAEQLGSHVINHSSLEITTPNEEISETVNYQANPSVATGASFIETIDTSFPNDAQIKQVEVQQLAAQKKAAVAQRTKNWDEIEDLLGEDEEQATDVSVAAVEESVPNKDTIEVTSAKINSIADLDPIDLPLPPIPTKGVDNSPRTSNENTVNSVKKINQETLSSLSEGQNNSAIEIHNKQRELIEALSVLKTTRLEQSEITNGIVSNLKDLLTRGDRVATKRLNDKIQSVHTSLSALNNNANSTDINNAQIAVNDLLGDFVKKTNNRKVGELNPTNVDNMLKITANLMKVMSNISDNNAMPQDKIEALIKNAKNMGITHSELEKVTESSRTAVSGTSQMEALPSRASATPEEISAARTKSIEILDEIQELKATAASNAKVKITSVPLQEAFDQYFEKINPPNPDSLSPEVTKKINDFLSETEQLFKKVKVGDQSIRDLVEKELGKFVEIIKENVPHHIDENIKLAVEQTLANFLPKPAFADSDDSTHVKQDSYNSLDNKIKKIGANIAYLEKLFENNKDEKAPFKIKISDYQQESNSLQKKLVQITTAQEAVSLNLAKQQANLFTTETKDNLSVTSTQIKSDKNFAVQLIEVTKDKHGRLDFNTNGNINSFDDNKIAHIVITSPHEANCQFHQSVDRITEKAVIEKMIKSLTDKIPIKEREAVLENLDLAGDERLKALAREVKTSLMQDLKQEIAPKASAEQQEKATINSTKH